MHATIDGTHQAMGIAGPIGADNCCSTCMSSQREDFEDNLVAVKYNVKGVGGARVRVRGVMIRTMNFTCQDNNVTIHRHRIPGSHFAPGLEARLLSPQHFAQSKGDTQRWSPLTTNVWSCNGTNGSTE